jgi:hypothetical protein
VSTNFSWGIKVRSNGHKRVPYVGSSSPLKFDQKVHIKYRKRIMKPYLTLTPCILWGNDMDGKSRHMKAMRLNNALYMHSISVSTSLKWSSHRLSFIMYLGFRSFTEIFRNDTKFHFTCFHYLLWPKIE